MKGKWLVPVSARARVAHFLIPFTDTWSEYGCHSERLTTTALARPMKRGTKDRKCARCLAKLRKARDGA